MAIKSSGATTRETRPHCAATSAEIASPVYIISAALDMPMMRGNNQAPPSPGTMPSLTKLSANLAFSDAMRMSHIQARSSPAPIAAPLTAAITGTSRLNSASGSLCMPVRYSCRICIPLTSPVLCRNILRTSPPEEKAVPAPVSMTALTLGSPWIRSMAANSSGTALLPVRGLRRSGSFIVNVTMCWSWS